MCRRISRRRKAKYGLKYIYSLCYSRFRVAAGRCLTDHPGLDLYEGPRAEFAYRASVAIT